MSSPESKNITPRQLTAPLDPLSHSSVPWFNLQGGMEVDSPPFSHSSGNLFSQFSEAQDEEPIFLCDPPSSLTTSLVAPDPTMPPLVEELVPPRPCFDQAARETMLAPSFDADESEHSTTSSSFDCESSSHELCDIPPDVCEMVHVVTHDIRTTVMEESSVKECASSLTDQSLTG